MSKSTFLKVQNTKLADYFEVRTNRVLKIDNINDEFSSSEDDRDDFSNIYTIDPNIGWNRFLVQVSLPVLEQYQILEIVTLNDDSDVFNLIKSNNTVIGNEVFSDVEAVTDSFGNLYLKFTPENPYDYDYDIKVFNNSYLTSNPSPEVGITSIGFVELSGNVDNVSAGSSLSILSVDVNKYDTIYAHLNVKNKFLQEQSYVELHLTHDGTNTYLSELYFDDVDGFNVGFIGTFTSYISGGVLNLDYTNTITDDVLVRYKNVGFGSTSIGIGTYRFQADSQQDNSERTLIYESEFDSASAGGLVDVFSMNENLFTSCKSLVTVSIGETKALHQLVTIHDGTDININQYPFISIGSTSGIGTFGGEYSGSDVVVKFYPDPGITGIVSVSSFNEKIYTNLDGNLINELEYYPIKETYFESRYFGVNLDTINKKEFELTYEGIPIFQKIFNPDITSVLDKETGTFSIKDHFFSNLERLIYTPRSTFAGIGESAVGIGQTLTQSGILTERLPEEVYVIKLNPDQFKLSTRRDYAQVGIFVTFTDSGEGNAHELEMYKKNEKSIISVAEIVQYPIAYTSLEFTLSDNGGQIGVGETIFSLSGIGSVNPRDILKIDDELIFIENVGLGTTSNGPITYNGDFSLIKGIRGSVGTSATSHSDGTSCRIYRGSYNIVGSSIFFTNPPRGSAFFIDDEDFSALQRSKSEFSGRVFLRNDYSSNVIYDDISESFTGLDTDYIITTQGINTVGLGSDGGNGVLFLNGIFQTPTTENNANNNFVLVEDISAGITTVSFTGITSSDGSTIITDRDVNQNELPRGGLVVSLGSTLGLGYAPLIGANVRGAVDAGVITSIIGIETRGTGNNISTASYNNVTGYMDVEVTSFHNYPSDADYVYLEGLEFSCSEEHVGVTTTIFPDGSSQYGSIFPILKIIDNQTFTVNVGTSTIPHNYVSSGVAYPYYYGLNFGSGYREPVEIIVTEEGHTGLEADITASVGIGGTLIFNIASGGTDYSAPEFKIKPPTYENIQVEGVSRLGVGETTDTGIGLLLDIEVSESSVSITGVGSDVNVLGVSTTTGDRFADAASLIERNKEFIANEAVNRMITFFGAYPGPGDQSDCEDDVVDVFETINYNLKYGGNDQVYDAANIYIQDPSLLAGEQEEAIYTFEEARDIAIQVMRNEVVTVSGATTQYSQIFDNTITIDPYGIPYCVDVASAIEQFVGIVTVAIGETTLPAKRVISSPTLFEIRNYKIARNGYGYRRGDVIRPVGLVTAAELYESGIGTPRSEFLLSVDDIFNDAFSLWNFGELNFIDSVQNYQDGTRKTFPLFFNSELISFQRNEDILDSQLIDMDALLLIFINGVLQDPGESYTFEGGTAFTFTDAPKPEDKISIFFYLGTEDQDSIVVDIDETIKIGDQLKVEGITNRDFYGNEIPNYNDLTTPFSQDARYVTNIPSADRVQTNIYTGIGIDDLVYRPFKWIKQKRDLIINGSLITKERDILEGQVYPTVKIIKDVLPSDTAIFVDDVSLFLYDNVSSPGTTPFSLIIYSENAQNVSAGITATVDINGSVTGVTINNPGFGYTGSSIDVTFSRPGEYLGVGITNLGLGIDQTSTKEDIDTAIESITASGQLSILNGQVVLPYTPIRNGVGYTYTNPPEALISAPPFTDFEITGESDFIKGLTVGITSIREVPGIGTDKGLEFTIDPGSIVGMQNNNFAVGYPIYVKDTTSGSGIISIDTEDDDIVGIGTTALDNVYYASGWDSTLGIITCNILSTTPTISGLPVSTANNIGVGITNNDYYVGRFSWGRISNIQRSSVPLNIVVKGNTASGLSTYPTIQRREYGLRSTGAIKKIIS